MSQYPKQSVFDLAVFGGRPMFDIPKSTSNLLQPDIQRFLRHSEALFDNGHLSLGDVNTQRLEQRLAQFHETAHCVTFSSGFWGLVLTLSAVKLAGKTEMIFPSLTYRRMADMAAWLGLKPHFCEVDPVTLAMTPDTVRPCINDNTAVILGVHPIVNGCDASGLVALAQERGIPIVFDSVESVYESLPDGRVGGFGLAEAFSLHACKLLNGFGGGYITTQHDELAQHLRGLRDGGVGGASYRLNELHATMTLASLDDVDDQVDRNRARYMAYQTGLHNVRGIRLLPFDERYRTGYKNIVVEIESDWPLTRDQTVQLLNAEKVLARVYYAPPLHQKPMLYESVPAHLPLTDELALRYLNLPCGHLVSVDDVKAMTGLFQWVFENAHSIKNAFAKLSLESLGKVTS